jgi:hypothetical protein
LDKLMYSEGNEIILTIQQENFIERVLEGDRSIKRRIGYMDDGQNVHNSGVQKSLRESIAALMLF